MQAEENGIGTGSFKIQANELIHNDKKHNSGREMPVDSHESHEKGGDKPARDVLHEGHAEDHEQDSREKSSHDHHGEGEQQDHDQHEEMNHQNHEQHDELKHKQYEEMKHEGHEPSGGKYHGNHHTHMLEDFRKRFIVSFVLTIPVLLLSPIIQGFFGFELHVPGADFITFLLSSIVYFYGGYLFLKGIKEKLAEKTPGMMTLIAVAISVAYFYSSAVVFGL